MSKTININQIVDINNHLTGKFRFRTNVFGKLILQVEYVYVDYQGDSSTDRRNWRDARVEDLTLLEPKD